MSVYWLISAGDSLRRAMHARLMQDAHAFETLQAEFNGTLAAVFPGQVILVRQRLSGYRDFDGLGIFLIEIQPATSGSADQGLFHSPGVYIVKIAQANRQNDLRLELKAWDGARPPQMRSDNIFVTLDPFPRRGEGGPIALVYGDATSELGSRNVMSLQEAVFRTCRFGQPRPESIVRLLKMLYQRLDQHFLSRSAAVDASSYLSADARPALIDVLRRWREPLGAGAVDPLPAAADFVSPPYDSTRQRVRRDTLPFLTEHEEWFADPADVLTGLWELRGEAGRLPTVRRGFAHGDLHALNVEISVVDDDASQCAVFDYEQMRRDNFIAWDFIKLEVELALRLLHEDAAERWPDFVQDCLIYWRYVAARTEEIDRHLEASHSTDADAAPWILSDPRLAEEAQKLPKSLLCLAEGAIQVRLLARDSVRNGFDWQREYDFLLAWYALRAGLYPNNTEDKIIAAALIGAGVSARRLQGEPEPSASETRPVGETGYRLRFLQARRLARSEQRSEQDEGVRRLRELRKSYPHVLEIDEELALAFIERRDYREVDAVLASIRRRYRHTTAETPSRLGSRLKRQATETEPFDRRALRSALEWYRQAEVIGHEYFPAVNVATLTWLLGDHAKARAQAARVLEILDGGDFTNDPFWPQATRGEALLLLGEDPAEAIRCYERAVADPDCTPRDRQSMRRQVECLRPYLDAAFQAALSQETLDRLFSRPASGSS